MDPFPSSMLLFIMLIATPLAAATTSPPDSAAVTGRSSGPLAQAAQPGSAHSAPATSRSAAPDDDLAATTAPPWNPPHAISRREMWEQVILFPQRVVSLPLSGLGWLAERGLFAIERTSLIKNVIVPEPGSAPKRFGIRFGPPGIGDRTGFGARVEAHAPFFGGGHLRSTLKVSHAATIRHYHDTRIGAYGGSGSVEYGYTWRPEDRFFGLGMGTHETDESSYASQVEQVRATLSTGWNLREHGGGPRTWVGAWVGPRWVTTRSGRERDVPSFENLFPDVAAPEFGRRVAHLVYGGRFTSDWRVGAPHWSNGWRVLFESQRFDAARSLLSLGIRGDPIAQFTRTTLEMETGFSFMRDPRTLRFLGRIVDQGVSAGHDRMLPYDYPSLGGKVGLAGFIPGRFHDNDLVLTRLSYVFPLVRRLEIETHVESGAVFDNLWHDAAIHSFRQSFGVALRGRMDTKPVGAIGIDASSEGVRLRYAIGNPE